MAGERQGGRGPGRRRGAVSRVLRIALGAVLLLAAGAAIPHVLTLRIPRPGAEPADAVIVLTGGENRIRAGYEAWRAGRGRDLLVLGVWKETTLDRILPEAATLPPDAMAHFHLEGWSGNTLENAISAKSLVVTRRYGRVILVTSDYHLARGHLAVRTLLPASVEVSVLPVPSEGGMRRSPLRVLRLYAVEGWKYWAYRVMLAWE